MSLQEEGGLRDFLVVVRLLVFLSTSASVIYIFYWNSANKKTANIVLVKKCQSSIL